MGMTDDFESSLQVLRGFDTDITVEVNEIKVNFLMLICVHQTSSGKIFIYKNIFSEGYRSNGSNRSSVTQSVFLMD